jgi:F-type H+-transporting ATPase subunit c
MNKKLQTAARVGALFVLSTSLAFAEDGGNMGPGIGAGLAVGLAALGGGFGQGKTASAALEGMARNPQAAGNLQTPMVLGLVFTETLTLFSFAIAYLLTSK